jgi:hypothetical protein
MVQGVFVQKLRVGLSEDGMSKNLMTSIVKWKSHHMRSFDTKVNEAVTSDQILAQ